jgi:hypothetical protein
VSRPEPVDQPPIWQRARSQFDLHGCKINRADLDRALALARQGFSPQVNVTIETAREYGGISSQIYGSSIDEMLSSLRQSTLPGDPDYLDNLSMTLTDPLLNPANRHLAIYIGPWWVRVIVEGEDPGWVRGQIGGLKDLFDHTRAKWLIPPAKRFKLFIFSLILFMLVDISAIVIGFIISDKAYHRHREIFILISLLCIVLIIGVIFADRIIRHRERTELRLLPGVPKRKIGWTSLLTLIATFLILVFTIIMAVGH